MSGPQVLHAAAPSGLKRDLPRHSLRDVLGEPAWRRLPAAVRARFGEVTRTIDYVGSFEIVRASFPGKILARACRLIGTPVAPGTGRDVPAVVRVRSCGRGVEWRREYRWPNRRPDVVRSTKVIAPDGTLVEELPAFLRMALQVYEHDGTLHFVSRHYYFDLPIPWKGNRLRLVLPGWLSPGTTHVEHIDEGAGWFRFTMTVTHPLGGELFFQTGRFRASGG